MEQLEQALAYLGRDPLFYMDMLEPLRRGTAELLYAEEDGVLLCESGGIHMMSAAGPAAAERCFALLSRCAMLVGHELWYKAEAARRFGLHEEQICYQAAWLAPEPPAAAPFGGELRLLGEEMAQWVYDHYSHPFGGVAYMQGALRRGMLGAFVDGACAGFAGFHEEGSIGMLEVLPPLGVEAVILPRLELGGQPVSASRVRQLWRQGNWRALEELTPPDTLAYLKAHPQH